MPPRMTRAHMAAHTNRGIEISVPLEGESATMPRTGCWPSVSSKGASRGRPKRSAEATQWGCDPKVVHVVCAGPLCSPRACAPAQGIPLAGNRPRVLSATAATQPGTAPRAWTIDVVRSYSWAEQRGGGGRLMHADFTAQSEPYTRGSRLKSRYCQASTWSGCSHHCEGSLPVCQGFAANMHA